MTILVISSNYPSFRAPQVGTFVYQIVQRFSLSGEDVYVVSPQIFSFSKSVLVNYGEERASISRPVTFSFSNKNLFFFNTALLSHWFQAIAIRKAVNQLDVLPEVVYCHFLISGLNYFRAYPNSKLPMFIAVGEYHNIDVVRKYFTKKYFSRFLSNVTGFIAVSPQVSEKLASLGVPNNKIIVEPNGVDRELFRPMDKKICREMFNLPNDKKIILFVGRCIDNKGPLRVLEALNYLPDNVGGVFIGKGTEYLEGTKILYKGPLAHNEISLMMNAADVFVLPTLHEGSSNVIVEAMSCGLPIVSSDLPEVKVQCDSSFSILVDPLDVSAIKNAIGKIVFDDGLLSQYSKSARSFSKRFDLASRANRILDFIRLKISES